MGDQYKHLRFIILIVAILILVAFASTFFRPASYELVEGERRGGTLILPK